MKFWFINPHPLVPPCWYHVVESADELLAEYKHHVSTAFRRWITNPHCYDENGDPKDAIAEALHPVLLGAGFLNTALKIYLKHGKVLIGYRGGMCQPPGWAPVREIESSDWPGIDQKEVKVFQWTGGRHYYVESALKEFGKFDTFLEAQQAVLKEWPKATVTLEPMRGQFQYKQEGD